MGQNIRIKDLWTPPQTPPLFCFLTPNFYVDDFYIILMFYFRILMMEATIDFIICNFDVLSANAFTDLPFATFAQW